MKKIISCIVLIALLIACSKTETISPTGQEAPEKASKNPTVTTTSVYVHSAIWARPSGNISNGGGGSSVVDRGFCYSDTPGPTITDDTVQAGSGAGNFTKQITGLTPGATYYVKAYGIKNNGDIFYGNELSFTLLTIGMPGEGVGLVYDQDGNEYHTITLGTQVWMVENLKATHYRNGDPIADITDRASWVNATDGAYCDYGNDPANSDVYGRLYNKYAVEDGRNIAPAGWHVPNWSEMHTMFEYVGGYDVAGGRLKEAGFDHWASPNSGADNSTGFTAVGAGMRYGWSGTFNEFQESNNLWDSGPSAGYWEISYNSDSYITQPGCGNVCLASGLSVRCVMD